MELNLARIMKGNKKGFYKYISRKRKTLENVGLLLNGAEDLVTKDMEEVKVLNVFFTLIFAGNTCLQQTRSLRPVEKSDISLRLRRIRLAHTLIPET